MVAPCWPRSSGKQVNRGKPERARDEDDHDRPAAMSVLDALPVPVVLAPMEDDPQSIVVSSSAVYWTNTYGGLVRSYTIGGSAHPPTTLTTDPTTLSGVARSAACGAVVKS